jgi:hypothetical protein
MPAAGDRFGAWTVVGPAKNRSVHCRCDCGTERVILTKNIKSGKTRSCGCMKADYFRTKRLKTTADRTGEKFGFFTVEGMTVRNGKTVCRCRCQCGNVSVIEWCQRVHRRSCGCASRVTQNDQQIGEKHGSLLIIGHVLHERNTLCVCKCDCGNERTLPYWRMSSRSTCGRTHARPKAPTAKRPGWARLARDVLEKHGVPERTVRRWLKCGLTANEVEQRCARTLELFGETITVSNLSKLAARSITLVEQRLKTMPPEKAAFMTTKMVRKRDPR